MPPRRGRGGRTDHVSSWLWLYIWCIYMYLCIYKCIGDGYKGIDCFISYLFDVFPQGSNKFKPNVERVDLGGGNSNIFGFFNPPSLGKWSNLTCACFSDGWERNHQTSYTNLMLIEDEQTTQWYRGWLFHKPWHQNPGTWRTNQDFMKPFTRGFCCHCHWRSLKMQ